MKDNFTITYTTKFNDDGPDEFKIVYSGTKKECAFLMRQKISGLSKRPIKSCFIEVVPPDRLITKSTMHMTGQERQDGIRQMMSDLNQLATRDGCIAAGWALEVIGKIIGRKVTSIIEELTNKPAYPPRPTPPPARRGVF